MILGEPAGADPRGGKVRRTPSSGAARGWACGEYPRDCLQEICRGAILPGCGTMPSVASRAARLLAFLISREVAMELRRKRREVA